MFGRKLFGLRFHSRNAYSTIITPDSHPHNLFYHFVSTKFNFSEAHIALMFKRSPSLQRLQTLEKVEHFTIMLNRYGCSQVQIAKIMMSQPAIITTSADKILKPKINLLEDFGFQGESLVKLLSSHPRILAVSLENELLPKMEFLKALFQSQELLIKCILRKPLILRYSLEKTLKPSVVYWERWGFQGPKLLRLIRIDPAILLRTSLTPAQADLIQEIRPDKESNAYKYIVSKVAMSRLETLKAKIEHLKLCGLSAEETWQLCRAAPTVLSLSKDTVRETMDFLVKDMQLPPNYIVTKSFLLLINLEKVMRPRFLVWQKIKSMNGPSLSLYTVLTMPEARFVRKIIRAHPESTRLWTLYENAISNGSKRTKISIQS